MAPCYCIALRTAARKVTALYDEALAPIGINIGQFSMMRRIARTDTVSLTELAKRCDLERSTVGRNAKVLERMGLVSFASGSDQREAVLSLTRRGRAALENGAPLWDEAQVRIEDMLGTGGVKYLKTLAKAA